MNKPALPQDFIDVLRTDMGPAEADKLIAALDGDPVVSVRFNPYKIGTKPEGRQVPWSRYGFYLDERPVFTADPLFHGGAYYVQEASSMFLEHIFSQVFADDAGPLKILDLCAAPGGKTTHLASLAGLESVVVANEVIRSRAKILSENVRKWGLGNVVVANNDPKHFSSLRGFFDLVVIDAPCSGEGMFRKNPGSREEWTINNVTLCASRQRRILADVWEALKPGGIMIYSTCTFNRKENEENIAWLAEEYGCEEVDVAVPEEWGVVAGDEGGIRTFRFYPHRLSGEGFFAAVLRKAGTQRKPPRANVREQTIVNLQKNLMAEASAWCNQPEFMRFGTLNGDRVFGYYAEAYEYINMLAEQLTVIYSGVEIGQLIGRKIKPEHSLAMFHDVSHAVVNNTELQLTDAMKYLRKADVPAELFAEGINLVSYEGLPIGWIKRIGNRCNNLYPKECRVLNDRI